MVTVNELYPDVLPNDRIVFIGFDPRETTAYQVLKHSIVTTSPGVKVFPLYAKDLRQAGLYKRSMLVEGTTGQFIDAVEQRPHSVEFSFTRFLVPEICRQLGHKGWALFMDCDMVVTMDLNPIFAALEEKASTAVAVVKHDFKPVNSIKMDGVSQLAYNKKLWSAVMFFNSNHEELSSLTAKVVNTANGMYLHSFEWLPQHGHFSILGLDEALQFIPGHSDKRVHTPVIIHYTEKAPWFKQPFQETGKWADVWWDYAKRFRLSLVNVGDREAWWV